jgi:hypothetical protein
MEHHHRVARNEALRETPFEFQRQRLLQLKLGVGNAVAHLQIIVERHGGNRVGVGFA